MKNILYISLSIIALLALSCKEDVKERVEARFSVDKQEIVSGDKVIFKDESLGNPTKWNWYFEGGTPETSILFSPEVVYTTPGSYSVKLVVSHGDTESSVLEKTEFIKVEYPDVLTADFKTDKTSVLYGEKVIFTDLSAGYPTSWAWEFISSEGEKQTSTEQNPEMSLPPGIYTVKLDVTNPKTSARKIKKDYLTVVDPNSVSAEFSSDYTITYSGGSIHYKDRSVGNATQWNWTFEGGVPESSTEQNPQVTYTKPGKYKVMLKTSNAVNSSVKEKEGYISIIPGEGLLAFYLFEENGKDVGPEKLEATVKGTGSGTVLFNEPARKEGEHCATFSNPGAGNYGYLQVDHNGLLNFGKKDFTISFWMKTNLKNKQMALWMNGGGKKGSGDSQTWFRLENGSSKNGTFTTEDNTGGVFCDYKAEALADDQWHHIVCIRNGMTLKIYVDGVEKAIKKGTALKQAGDDTPLLLGCMAAANSGRKQYYTGYMDDVVLYNRAITIEEIQMLYTY